MADARLKAVLGHMKNGGYQVLKFNLIKVLSMF